MNKAWWEPDEPEVVEQPKKVVQRVKRTKLKGEHPKQVIVDEVAESGLQYALRAHLKKRMETEAAEQVDKKVEAILKPISKETVEAVDKPGTVKLSAVPSVTTGNTTTYDLTQWVTTGSPITYTQTNVVPEQRFKDLQAEMKRLEVILHTLKKEADKAARRMDKIVEDLASDKGSPRDDLSIELSGVSKDLWVAARQGDI